MRIAGEPKRATEVRKAAPEGAVPGDERSRDREVEPRGAGRTRVDAREAMLRPELTERELSVLHEVVRSARRRLPAPIAREIGSELIGRDRKDGHASWAAPALRRLLVLGHVEVAGKRGRARAWAATDTGRRLVEIDGRASR